MDADDVLKASLTKAIAECERLREENTQLRLRVEESSASSLQQSKPIPSADNRRAQSSVIVTLQSSPEDKVRLFRNLFRGRDDVYARRWEAKNGRTGYSPAGIRQWDERASSARGEKKSFYYEKLFPVTNGVIRDHLLGRQTIGVYPLLQDDTCWFVAIDFDKRSWETDVRAFINVCQETGVPAFVERSRSGNGAHLWIFFANPIQAALARKLASAILSRTMEQHYAIGLDSYDRLFPSQDTMPKGGFGNLIALPLQHSARENGNSVFVDDEFRPYDDQWEFLSSITRLTREETQGLLRKLYPTGDVLNIKHSEFDYDEPRSPWTLPPSGQLATKVVAEPLPERVSITLGNLIYVEKNGLPDIFLDRLVRLAAFQNPEFYKTQAMRLSTFGKPRVIACAADLPHHIALPRGLLQEVLDLFDTHSVSVEQVDQRVEGVPVQFKFHGERRPVQTMAAKTLNSNDTGILCAPTAFGKTAVAAQLIAMRGMNTLVMVHRRQLLDQWRQRLASYLDVSKKEIGQIGGGKTVRTGLLDVAIIQSLIRKGEVKDFVADYGQVIVDECHHISAFSFERVMRQVKAKYVVGLTATPVRKDGHHPIIFMQCGPIRFDATRKKPSSSSVVQYHLVPRITEFTLPPERNDMSIHDVYSALVNDERRTELIIDDVLGAIEAGRFPLLLTERTDHVELFLEKLGRLVPNVFVMKGGMGKKQRDSLLSQIKAVPESEPRIIIATGRYIGEGFDDARLDTLFLAMPISWHGTLKQYVGRLHRLHAHKRVVQVYDYIDSCVPVLNRMYEKRLKAYRDMGYRLAGPLGYQDAQPDLRFAAIEEIAVRSAIEFEEARGCIVESVESDARGFDLISRRTSSNTARQEIETRFIEVKGRAASGEIALTANEYKTAQRMGEDYWLYVVFNCASQPEVTVIQNPARFDWQPVSKIDCYRLAAESILKDRHE